MYLSEREEIMSVYYLLDDDDVTDNVNLLTWCKKPLSVSSTRRTDKLNVLSTCLLYSHIVQYWNLYSNCPVYVESVPYLTRPEFYYSEKIKKYGRSYRIYH